MAIYSVGRRRVILALILTSVLLLTLDLRGNPVLDRIRDGFALAMRPVESATDVVTTPLERVWNGVTNYDDLERENQALQDRIDRLIGTQAVAELSVLEVQELRALLGLPSLAGIPTEIAKVVGASANNLDQIIEINVGSLNGIRIGMPVVNQAGLIGRITSVSLTTSKVLLITDARYTVAVRVQAAPVDESAEEVTVNTSPTGRTVEELLDLTTTTVAPSTTLPTDILIPDTTLPQNNSGAIPGDDNAPEDDGQVDGEVVTDPLAPGETLAPGDTLAPDDTLAPGDAVDPAAAPSTTLDPITGLPPSTTSTTTTTTTLPEVQSKEFGALEGRGRGLLPQIRFLQDNPGLTELEEGDIVVTAGGSESLAPSDIPVGVVINRADRSGPGGPLLDVAPHADVTKLNFVRVVKFAPQAEAGS